jgi:hypothetical protein
MDNVLIAKEGYVYTNGETFSGVVRLGINDNINNWYEITEEEAEKMQNVETPDNNEETEPNYKELLDIITGGADE